MTEDDGPNGRTLGDAAVKTHESLVEAFLQAQAQARPKRVARVYAKFAHLSDRQITYRQGREQWLSDLMGQSLDIAVDINGNRIYPASDV